MANQSTSQSTTPRWYYHIYCHYIDITGLLSGTLAYDADESYIRKEIAASYMQNKRFILAGKVIRPSDIDEIAIYKSKIPWKMLTFPSGSPIHRASTQTVLNAFNDGEIPDVEQCTRDFITSTSQKMQENDYVKTQKKSLSKNVFIVHGRELKFAEELKKILIEVGLTPIILHEQASGSLTVAEKLKNFSNNCGYAFVILSPDDVGCLDEDLEFNLTKLATINESLSKSEKTLSVVKDFEDIKRALKEAYGSLDKIKISVLKKRARQNVVLEFGYFMGMLGREKVCCLYKGDIELPSDMHGIVYVPFKDSINECSFKILKELKEAGYDLKI